MQDARFGLVEGDGDTGHDNTSEIQIRIIWSDPSERREPISAKRPPPFRIMFRRRSSVGIVFGRGSPLSVVGLARTVSGICGPGRRRSICCGGGGLGKIIRAHRRAARAEAGAGGGGAALQLGAPAPPRPGGFDLIYFDSPLQRAAGASRARGPPPSPLLLPLPVALPYSLSLRRYRASSRRRTATSPRRARGSRPWRASARATATSRTSV